MLAEPLDQVLWHVLDEDFAVTIQLQHVSLCILATLKVSMVVLNSLDHRYLLFVTFLVGCKFDHSSLAGCGVEGLVDHAITAASDQSFDLESLNNCATEGLDGPC